MNEIGTPAFTICQTIVGELTLVADADRLIAVLWPDDRPARVPLPPLVRDDAHPVLHMTMGQLGEYFAGTRQAFDLPLHFIGTPFQRSVWQELLVIPYGETRSYAEIAHRIGRPGAVRAVGAANGRNPLSIVAPCHRVVGSTGALTGFAGGLAVKRRLLALEAPPLFARVDHQASSKGGSVERRGPS